MWGIHAFQETIDEAGAYTEIAAVPDQVTKAIGDYIYVPKTNKLCACYAATGATIPGIPYLDAPSLRRQHVQYIHPVVGGLVSSTNTSLSDDIYNPITLQEGEGVKCMSNANPVAAEVHTIVLMMSDGIITPVKGEIFTLYYSAAITGVVGQWVSGNITLSQDLPIGNYSIVGGTFVGDNMIASRLIFNTQMSRPGALGQLNAYRIYQFQSYLQYGRAGVWGTFHSLTPPQLEILVIASCTSQTGYLQLIKM